MADWRRVQELLGRMPDKKGPLVAAIFRDAGFNIHKTAEAMRSLGYSVEVQAPAKNGQYILYMSRYPTGHLQDRPELCGDTADPALFGEVLFRGSTYIHKAP